MEKYIQQIINKVPSWEKIIPVYATITLLIYGWTFYWSVHELPAWLNYLQVSEIISIYSYSVLVNFLESLFILFIMIALCIVFPVNWFLSDFVYRGTSLSIFIIAYLIAMVIRRSQIMVFSTNMVKWFPLILFLAFILILVLEKLSFIKKLVEKFADNAIIFLYINIPISFIAIISIVARNIK